MTKKWQVAFYPENSGSETKPVVRVWFKGVEVTGVRSVHTFGSEHGQGITLDIDLLSEIQVQYLEDGQVPPDIVS